jgi:hypothetical protein
MLAIAWTHLYFFISSIELEVCAGCTNLREIVSGGPDDMSGLKIFRESHIYSVPIA